MPYKQYWVEPHMVLKENGVRVYNSYLDDDYSNGPAKYIYTTDIYDRSCFDIRELSCYEEGVPHVEILRRAIREGHLTKEGPGIKLDSPIVIPLPDGTRLIARGHGDGDYPCIQIFHRLPNETEELLCFVEYNPEKDAPRQICVGTYIATEEDTAYYAPYYDGGVGEA